MTIYVVVNEFGDIEAAYRSYENAVLFVEELTEFISGNKKEWGSWFTIEVTELV